VKFFQGYVPFLLALVAGIVCFDIPWIHGLWCLPIPLLFYQQKYFFYAVSLMLVFELGIFLHQFRENELVRREKAVSTYLDQKIILYGKVVSHPIPAQGKHMYVLLTDRLSISRGDFYQNFRIQITSKSYQAPQKGDRVEVHTKLFAPKILQNYQKIKNIQAYGVVYGDKNWKLIQAANLYSTEIRSVIFKSARTHLSSTSYGYYRAMVFGDQAFLSQRMIDRLKETGLLHLFVISGSHIAFVLSVGLFIFMGLLLWIRPLHREKNFIIFVELGSIITVFVFLELINPPISTFRAVGSMILFLLLKILKRNQFPLWNLGVVFMVTILFNPLYLFDVSTQLTFASVAGIICGHNLSKKWLVNRQPIMVWIGKVCAISLGAGLFTLPILYYHFGTFYILSFVYNLILGTTLGTLVSFLAVASLTWVMIPIDVIHQVMFGILDYLFLLFEKMILWEPDFGMAYASGLDFTGISGGYGLIGVGAFGMAFIITRHFFKKRTYL
jgi:ComEC/Rec2-related protein